MEPYSETPLNLALRNERKAEEFIKTWRFNHAAHYYQKAADNISRALEEERANNLVPNSILKSLEEQKKFYLYQEQVCQTRRSHVGHLFKDKKRLSYNLTKQAKQFAQAHSLLIHSQNNLQQQSQELERNNRNNKPANCIEQLQPTTNITRLIAEALKPLGTATTAATIENSVVNKDDKTSGTEKSNYNITLNPLCDYCNDDNLIIDTTTNTTANSKALVLRPPDSSLAVMAVPNHSMSDRARDHYKNQRPMDLVEEEAEDYDIGDKFNGGSVAHRNLLFEINRLFSEHNTLLDYLSTTTGDPIQQCSHEKTLNINEQPQHHHQQPSQLCTDKHGSENSNKNGRLTSGTSKGDQRLSDQQLSDTFGKLRWNQSKLRSIISDLVQQLEKTSEDNERLRCQIMTLTRQDSRLDRICPLPPLEPPTLQY